MTYSPQDPNLLRLEQGAKNEARGVLGRFMIGATGDFMVQMRIKSSVKLKATYWNMPPNP